MSIVIWNGIYISGVCSSAKSDEMTNRREEKRLDGGTHTRCGAVSYVHVHVHNKAIRSTDTYTRQITLIHTHIYIYIKHTTTKHSPLIYLPR